MFATKYAEPAVGGHQFVLFPGTYAIEVKGRTQQPLLVQFLATSRLDPKHAML